MFQRNKRNDVLPSTHYGTGGGGGGGLPFAGGGGSSFDGSGRSIKMEAPVVKAWKKASGYTRGSYYSLGVTLFMVFYGFRSMRYWNASIWLTCHLQECTLEVTAPGTRAMTVVFPREQLHSAQAIKTDKEGNYLSLDTDKYEPPERKKKKKKYKNTSKPSWNSKGPDSQGRYRTYRINLLKERPENETRKNALEFADFSMVEKYIMNTENDMYALHFRHFGLSQSRMRVKSGVNKVESYVKKRRQKLVVKESANLPWQGILCLVFGLVGVLLTLLVGQFYEEEPRKQGGPGARRSQQKASYRSSNRGRPMPSRPKQTGQYHKNY
mmetsp:Transcript_2229/g.4706  ORF Transcript_2229/g.4706 Transcript_2229/m.4706 type:complete len:324 (-) Transcript_2229:563-1534(-)